MTFSGPTPPFSNPPIEPDNYQPRIFPISGITLGRNTIIDTSVPMDYVIGQQVRLSIPPGYGCVQLNQVSGYVTEILSETSILTDIDSSQGVNAFHSAIFSRNQPRILAIGDINSGVVTFPNGPVSPTLIPGSFINIS